MKQADPPRADLCPAGPIRMQAGGPGATPACLPRQARIAERKKEGYKDAGDCVRIRPGMMSANLAGRSAVNRFAGAVVSSRTP